MIRNGLILFPRSMHKKFLEIVMRLQHCVKGERKLVNTFILIGLVVGFYGRLSHEGPRPMDGMSSVGVFLRDPSPYLREFRRKPRKTPNG